MTTPAETSHSRIHAIFARWTTFSYHYALWVLLAALLVAVASGLYVARNLGMNTDTATFGAASARTMGLDTRQDLSTTVARPTLAAAVGTQVLALPASSPAFNLAASEVRDIITPDTPVVLRPGTVLWLQVSAVNLQLDAKYWWRERTPSDSELQ